MCMREFSQVTVFLISVVGGESPDSATRETSHAATADCGSRAVVGF